MVLAVSGHWDRVNDERVQLVAVLEILPVNSTETVSRVKMVEGENHEDNQ
jgi:hypothetical protein